MSEEKKQRDTKTIQQEYSNLAFRAGNLQYEISEKGKDLALLNNSMRDLNFEFIGAKAAEDAAAKASAEAPKENG